MITLDWKAERLAVMEWVKKGEAPFKVSSFFPSAHKLPSGDEDMMSHYPDLKISTVDYDQKDFIQKIRQGLNPSMSKKEETIFSYRSLVDSDPEKFHRIKCYEDLIPKEFVSEIATSVSENDLRDFCDSQFSEDYYYRFFYGLNKQTTSPHFDWSPFNSLLLQLYGEKQVILFDTQSFDKFNFFYNYLDFDFFELKTFADKNSIPHQIVSLNTGEGLFIPPYCAHAINYLSDSSSFSLRFLPMKLRSRLHHVLPANFLLGFLLDKLPKKNLLNQDLVNHFLSIKNYPELVQLYDELAFKHFGFKVNHQESSLKYEEAVFIERNSFDYQLKEKARRAALIQRGAAFFNSL